MVQVAGYIVFPFVDENDVDEVIIPKTSAEVLKEIYRILEPQFPNIHAVIQNAVHGVAFFNFSNHAGDRRQALEQCSAYLQKLQTEQFPVNWHIDFRDDETGEYLVLQSERN